MDTLALRAVWAIRTDNPMIITSHAVERYQERVANVPDDEARSILRALANIAAIFAAGAQVIVRLPTGQRIVVKDGSVITVLPTESYKRNIRRIGRGRYE